MTYINNRLRKFFIESQKNKIYCINRQIKQHTNAELSEGI